MPSRPLLLRNITNSEDDFVCLKSQARMFWGSPASGYFQRYQYFLNGTMLMIESKQTNCDKDTLKEYFDCDQVEFLDMVEVVQKKIGQELHDGVEQELVGLGMISQALLTKLSNHQEAVTVESLNCYMDLARKIIESSCRAHEELKMISRGLVSENAHHHNLLEALNCLAARTDVPGSVRCVFRCGEGIVSPEPCVSLQLYRIAQEAVCNSLKHSGASDIRISFDRNDQESSLAVTDNGGGFSNKPSTDGLGLRSMASRAGLIGATLEISTIYSGGTSVCCKWTEA